MNLTRLTDEQLAKVLKEGISLPQEIINPVNPTPTPAPAPQTSSLDLAENTSPEPTQQEYLNSPKQPTPEPERAEGFDFQDPEELLYFLDDDVKKGAARGGIDLYPWQVGFMRDFADKSWDVKTAFHALVRAANGSGKDKYIIAACAVWLCMRYLKAWSVITSSSGQQLDLQTCKHITYLCQKANEKFGCPVWKIRYRHYTCLATGSPIDCFATDEPGKAEGWHPIDAGCKLALFMSEAKTVTDEINEAYDRCDGYTHRVHVSSPGPPIGHFYDDCLQSTPRKSLSTITSASPLNYVEYVVTGYDCPHISNSNRIERVKQKYGEKSVFYLSSIMAEFSSNEERVVIPFHFVQSCINSKTQWVKETYNKAGLDLADGGDETVLIVRNGNKVLKIVPFRFDKSTDTIAYLDTLFRDNGLTNKDAYIYADCGGIGKPMLDVLRSKGWLNIRYVDNRWAAEDKKVYYKRATEMWFSLKKFFERGEIIIPDDKLLKEQLGGRYYKIRTDNTLHLLSKVEQKAKGYKSPDRADSLVLAFADYKTTWKESVVTDDSRPFKVEPIKKPTPSFSQKEWAYREVNNPLYTTNASFRSSRDLDLSGYKEEIRLFNERVLANKTNQ